jgi:phosphate transport system substrate-binding protein
MQAAVAGRTGAAGLVQFPSVIGGVVPVVNVPGLTPGARSPARCSPTSSSARSSAWNDAAIVALNPGVACRIRSRGPSLRRLGHHLQLRQLPVQGQPEWKQKVGEGTTVKWPAGIGGKGNEGVAAYVKQIKGGIGYVELSYALQNKMALCLAAERRRQLRRSRTRKVSGCRRPAPTGPAAQDFNLVITDAPGARPGRSPPPTSS